MSAHIVVKYLQVIPVRRQLHRASCIESVVMSSSPGLNAASVREVVKLSEVATVK